LDRQDPLEISDWVSICNCPREPARLRGRRPGCAGYGGIGYSRVLPFEHLYRHQRRDRISEGSEEVQMRRVAQYLFGFGGKKTTQRSGPQRSFRSSIRLAQPVSTTMIAQSLACPDAC
jgi:acyl-CoA dehydrogenase